MLARKRCRVLVTGAGSGVGQGVVKSLRIAELPITVVGGDIEPMNAALYRTDEAITIPRVESDGALDAMAKAITAAGIDIVLVGSEFDLEFFSVNTAVLRERTGARVVVCPPETVAIANDKWLTAEFLRTHGLPYALSSLPASAEEAEAVASSWGYPVMVKTRRGTSSRHVHVARTADQLVEAWRATPNPMLQRMLAPPSSSLSREYTSSVFKTARGTVLGPFHARRTLRGGTSWNIEVDRFPELDALLLDIGGKLPIEGSLNVQHMLSESGPVPFELNARFSGTTAVRAHFGFNEPRMAVQSYFYGEEPAPPTIGRGVVMRYVEEVFIDGESAAEITVGRSRGTVHPWF